MPKDAPVPMDEPSAAPDEALRLAMKAGEIMLKNGAETYRVEDTMQRMLRSCGYDSAEAFATATGLFVSVADDASGAVTMMRRVRGRGIDYGKVAQANDVSRALSGGSLTVAEAASKLDAVAATPLSSPFVRIFASGVASLSFTYIFGSGYSDCINAFFTGLMLQVFVIPLRKSGVTSVLVNILGGALISFLSLTLMNLGLGENVDKVIIGSLMPMVPGVAITNGIRDVLEGDYLSGTSQLVEAVIIAASLAAGIGTVLKIWLYSFGGVII